MLTEQGDLKRIVAKNTDTFVVSQNTHDKDTVAWTLGRICDLLISTIGPDVHLHPLVSALVTGLQDHARIVANRCWELMNLADQLDCLEGDDETTLVNLSPLSPY